MVPTISLTKRTLIIACIPALIALIAVADRRAGSAASLGVFYLIPMVLGGIALPLPAIIALAFVCSCLRSLFDVPTPAIEIPLRFVFATLAYVSGGLFVKWLIRNRELQERLRILVESSPAGIVTIGPDGLILAANRATRTIFATPNSEPIEGRPIGNYLPVLADALAFDSGGEGLRASAQCQGRRDDGEVFLASTWFSSYDAPGGRRLAAIIADASEEMRDREEVNMRQMMTSNRIAAAGVSHEIRNLCGAIAVVSINLRQKAGPRRDEDIEALTSLVKSLESVASIELHTKNAQTEDEVDLGIVLDDLRIVIEPRWREIDGAVNLRGPSPLPRVVADRHGLLQVFLNLAQNSRRAVQDSDIRELSIVVSRDEHRAFVRFVDTGCGVRNPERLFAPFQPGAEGAGLGLYISRALMRACGGDIKFEPRGQGSCFSVELLIAA